jgi:hypothetical protein
MQCLQQSNRLLINELHCPCIAYTVADSAALAANSTRTVTVEPARPVYHLLT